MVTCEGWRLCIYYDYSCEGSYEHDSYTDENRFDTKEEAMQYLKNTVDEIIEMNKSGRNKNGVFIYDAEIRYEAELDEELYKGAMSDDVVGMVKYELLVHDREKDEFVPYGIFNTREDAYDAAEYYLEKYRGEVFSEDDFTIKEAEE